MMLSDFFSWASIIHVHITFAAVDLAVFFSFQIQFSLVDLSGLYIGCHSSCFSFCHLDFYFFSVTTNK